MTLTIFGATGMVGRRLVEHALYEGHTIMAFGRNVYTSDFKENEKLHLIQGALFDEQQVYDAILRSDAVLSALGGAFDGTDKTRSLGMKNIVMQMQKAGVKRIIAIGGKGILDSRDGGLIMEEPMYPRQFIPVGIEHFKAYELLKASTLKWTFIGAPDLVDGPATGTFFTAADGIPSPDKNKININDLALFMLDELKKNEYVGHRVGISNG